MGGSGKNPLWDFSQRQLEILIYLCFHLDTDSEGQIERGITEILRPYGFPPFSGGTVTYALADLRSRGWIDGFRVTVEGYGKFWEMLQAFVLRAKLSPDFLNNNIQDPERRYGLILMDGLTQLSKKTIGPIGELTLPQVLSRTLDWANPKITDLQGSDEEKKQLLKLMEMLHGLLAQLA